MTDRERLELAHWVAGLSKRSGADEAAVNIVFRRSVEVTYQDRKLDTLSETTQNGLTLDVYLGGRYSSHSTNDLRRDGLNRFVDDAVAMTRYLAPDPDRSITDTKYYEGLAQLDLKTYDEQYENVTPEERIRFARELEESALAASKKVVTCTGNYSDSTSASVKVHSNGFEGESRSTRYQAYGSVTLRAEDEALIDDYHAGGGLFRTDLPSPESLGVGAVERAWRKNGQSKIASGIYDMVVDNRVMGRLLGATIACITGAQLYRRNTFLLDKLDERIASEVLTVTDEPLLVSGLGSRLYDGDGIPARTRVILERGVLKTYLIDYFWSRKLKVEPTTGGTSNVLYSYGDRSQEQIVQQLDRGILVTGFIGGNYNPTTGDFSYGVMGELIENGHVVQAINEMNISGNYQSLWNSLVELGNDPNPLSANRCPSMLFREVQFAGA